MMQLENKNGNHSGLDYVLTAILSLTLLFSLLADPVVRSFGIAELSLGAAILSFAFACMLPLIRCGRLVLPGLGFLECVMIGLAASFALSAAISVIEGLKPFVIFRSVAPYAVGFLALPFMFSKRPSVDMRVVLWGVLLVGLAQACYQIYLFVSQGNTTVVQTLVDRITLLDARVTLPLAAAANGVALAMIGRSAPCTATGFVATVIFGLAALVTLTRTLVMIYACTALVAIVLWVVVAFSTRCWAQAARNASCLAVACLSIGILSVAPQFKTLHGAFQVRQAIESKPEAREALSREQETRALEKLEIILGDEVGSSQASATLAKVTTLREAILAVLRQHGVATLEKVVQRYAEEGDEGSSAEIIASIIAQFSASVPGSNEIGGGRISDEWIPALLTFEEGNLVSRLFGIGAGNPFTTGSGSSRTYIHNFPIYLLLYNGILGLALYLALQVGLAWAFIRRIYASNDFVAFACLSIMTAIDGFALLFAVHKLIAFNVLVAVVLIAYLRQEKRNP